MWAIFFLSNTCIKLNVIKIYIVISSDTSLMLCWSSGLVCSCRGAMYIASLGNIRYKDSDTWRVHSTLCNPVHDALLACSMCIAGLPDILVALLQAVQVGRYLCSDGTLVLAVYTQRIRICARDRENAVVFYKWNIGLLIPGNIDASQAAGM